MDTPKSFAAIAASKRATFISYREAVEKLAAATGDTLNEIAAGLLAADIHQQHAAFLGGIEMSVRQHEFGHCIELGTLLEETVRTGKICVAWYDSRDSECNPDCEGWMREPFVAALREAGMPCPDSLLAPPPYRVKATPAPPWTLPFVSRRHVLLKDAARMLAGHNPAGTYKLAAEDTAKISEWDAALCDAIHADEIALADGEADEELTDDTLLVHASIRAWCTRWGHVWPVPDVSPRPAPDTDVIARLDETLGELEKVRGELSAARDEIGAMRAELPPVEGRLREVIVAVGRRFWTPVPEGKRRPKAGEIVAWIREQYAALSEAEAICAERAACPVDRDNTPAENRDNDNGPGKPQP